MDGRQRRVWDGSMAGRSRLWAVACASGASAGVLVAFADDIGAAAHQWWNNPLYSYCLLVPAVAVWMLWLRRTDLADAPTGGCWAGLLLAVAAAASWWLADAAAVSEIRQLAVVLMLQAVVLAVLGPAVFRVALLPLVTLLLAVPAGTPLIAPLQAVTVAGVTALLDVGGMVVGASGTLISGEWGLYHVAPGCSGLNFVLSALTLAAVATAAARRGWMGLAVTALGFVAVAVAANILRVALLIAIAEAVEGDTDLVNDHLLFGWLLFMAAMVLPLRLAVRTQPRAEAGSPPGGAGRLDPVVAAGGVVAVVVGLQVASALPAAAAHDWEAMPPAPAGWTEAAITLPVAADTAAEAWVQRAYRADGAAVELTVGWFGDQRPGHKVAAPDQLLTGWGVWERLDIADSPVAAWRYEAPGGPRLAVSWYWVAGCRTDSLITARLHNIAVRLGAEAPVALVVASAPAEDGFEALARFLDDAGASAGFPFNSKEDCS